MPCSSPTARAPLKKGTGFAGVRQKPKRVQREGAAGVDALGNPSRFILTAGQERDIKQAEALPEDADKRIWSASVSYRIADSYLSFLQIAATLIWLKRFVHTT